MLEQAHLECIILFGLGEGVRLVDCLDQTRGGGESVYKLVDSQSLKLSKRCPRLGGIQ